MTQMQHVLAFGTVALLAMTSAVPLADAHYRGGAYSLRNSYSHRDYGRSIYGNYRSYYAHRDHRDHGHPGRNSNGDNFGFGGDCGWLHCHTAMPWG